MNSTDELVFIRRVLTAFDAADEHGALFWRIGLDVPGQLVLYAMCNDLFWWATADAEPITSENIDLLEQTQRDIADLNGVMLSDLFSARARKMRPQRPFLDKQPEAIRALFEACGPERDRKDEG